MERRFCPAERLLFSHARLQPRRGNDLLGPAETGNIGEFCADGGSVLRTNARNFLQGMRLVVILHHLGNSGFQLRQTRTQIQQRQLDAFAPPDCERLLRGGWLLSAGPGQQRQRFLLAPASATALSPKSSDPGQRGTSQWVSRTVLTEASQRWCGHPGPHGGASGSPVRRRAAPTRPASVGEQRPGSGPDRCGYG